MNFDKEKQKENKKYEKFGLTENPFKIYYPTDSLTGWYTNHGEVDTKEFDFDDIATGNITCPRLKTTTIGKYWICTIKLPDNWSQKTQGYAYETMIIQDDPENPYPQAYGRRGDHRYQFHIPSGQGSGGLEYQERCYTEDEALLQHEKAVLYINKLMGK